MCWYTGCGMEWTTKYDQLIYDQIQTKVWRHGNIYASLYAEDSDNGY